MPTYYTPITDGTPGIAATWNNVLTQLDNAIIGHGSGSVALATPTISSFTNSQHTHQNAAGGGKLAVAAISSSGYTAGQVPVSDGALGWTATTLVQLPVGIMLPYGGASAPTGWLLCDGQAVSRTTYAALFAIIGTLFGAGDGSTTFNVPDLRGRVPVGQDDMGGSSANRITAAWADTVGQADGAETHTLTTGEMPPHTHTTGASSSTNFSAGANAAMAPASPGIASGSAGSGNAHNNIQPSIAVNFIVKF